MTASVLDTGTALNLIRKVLLPVTTHNSPSSIHQMSVASASKNPVLFVCKVQLFVLLKNLHLLVHFDIMHDLYVLLLVETSLIDRYVKGILSMKCQFVPI